MSSSPISLISPIGPIRSWLRSVVKVAPVKVPWLLLGVASLALPSNFQWPTRPFWRLTSLPPPIKIADKDTPVPRRKKIVMDIIGVVSIFFIYLL